MTDGSRGVAGRLDRRLVRLFRVEEELSLPLTSGPHSWLHHWGWNAAPEASAPLAGQPGHRRPGQSTVDIVASSVR